MIRLLSAAQWQQSKRAAASDAKRRELERTRRVADTSDLLERLDDERRVYGRRAFDDWLHRRSLTAAPAVVDRLDVSTAPCRRKHRDITPTVSLVTFRVSRRRKR